MNEMLFAIVGFCILIIIYLLFTIYRKKQIIISNPEFDYNSIIQKKTSVLYFNDKGKLLAISSGNPSDSLLSSLKIGDDITSLTKIKNISKYFESAKKFQKTVTLKLIEEANDELGKRHDIIFSPFNQENDNNGVALISQELISRNKDKQHMNQQKELEEQRNYALRQIDEIEAQKSELEQAFKKSSKHHIMLQKALRKIEMQKEELETALETINVQKVELEKANKEIRESSRMKEIFLANTSHEIRTPLNAIIGFTNLLLNSALEETQKKYIENIKASGNNLLVVINDILDFSKIESGKLALEKIEFDFRNLISHTLNTLSVKSQEKNIELKIELSDEIPEVVIGDPVRLNQILINLIGNAIKFTSQNGYVRLLTTMGQPSNNKIKLLFKVEDNGIGIPRDKLKDIFQSFTQGESDTTRKFGGTGLGLSIVKQLIELQEGEITVDSEINKGTVFTFYIMLQEGKPKTEPQLKAKKKRKEQIQSTSLRILLVEDNLINQQLAYDTIKAWNKNIQIDVAQNGKVAVEKVSQVDYHLILMDIQMPEMDGNEATINIRKMPGQKSKVPIVAMTAHALKNEKENCLKIGMNDYISKPFDPEDLYEKILSYAPQGSGNNNSSNPAKEDGEGKQAGEKQYRFFHLKNLQKIYQNNDEKIVKIVKMCQQSIPTELVEINQAFTNKEWDILRNKVHSLKPKLGYLGMSQMQENAKQIEIMAQKQEDPEKINALLNAISEHWNKAEPEIIHLVNSKGN